MNARSLAAFGSVLSLGSLGVLALVGCGGVVAPSPAPSPSSSGAPSGAEDGGAPVPPALDAGAPVDARAAGDVAADAPAFPDGGGDTALLRIAHLDARVGRSDVCVAPADATTIGPWTRIVDGLGYEEVSRYVAVPVRTRVVRLVPPAGACDASTEVGGSFTTALVAGSRATFGVVPRPGEGGFYPGGAVWIDHAPSATPGLQLRFVDALEAFSAVDVAIDFGGGAPAHPTFSGLWTDGVATASPAGPVTDGYLSLDGAGVLGTVDVRLVDGVDGAGGVDAGSTLRFPSGLFLTRLISIFLVGGPDGHPAAPELLVCFDDLDEATATRCTRVGLHGPLLGG